MKKDYSMYGGDRNAQLKQIGFIFEKFQKEDFSGNFNVTLKKGSIIGVSKEEKEGIDG